MVDSQEETGTKRKQKKEFLMKQLAVCGTWNESGGKPSGYMKKFFEHSAATIHNGGTWDELTRILYEDVPYCDTVYWFPDVPNNKPKLVKDVKKIQMVEWGCLNVSF